MSINLRLLLALAVLAAILGPLAFIGARTQGELLVLAEEPRVRVEQGLVALARIDGLLGRLSDRLGLEGGLPGAGEDLSEPLLTALHALADTALSTNAQEAVQDLTSRVAKLGFSSAAPSERFVRREIDAARDTLTRAQSAYTIDSGRLTAVIDARVRQSMRLTWLGAVGILLCASLFAAILSRLVARPIEMATASLRELAAGRVPEAIAGPRRGDIGALFEALRGTTTFLATTVERQSRQLVSQASQFDHRFETHHNRFEAALHNMTQGLCMFDSKLSLIVFNEPFARLFPNLVLGAPAEAVLSDPRFHGLLAPHETGAFVQEMPNGVVLQVKRRGVKGGGLVVTFDDVTEQHVTGQRLEHLAGHDGLTGLANRRRFRDSLAALLDDEAARRNATVFCLDLIAFKSVNDTFGHPVGDALLVAVARRLAAEMSARDLIARLGGDEFAAIQADGHEAGASQALADRLVKTLEVPFEIEGRHIQIGVSIGFVQLASLGGKALPGADTIMQNCDLALYAAKNERRSMAHAFQPRMRKELDERRGLETDLREALDRRELELFYQPFVDAEKRRVSGFEALMRWRHPERGFVSPGVFVPLAEELGLIERIGAFALDEAMQAAARWPEALTISVNLSPLQFRNGQLVGDVSAALQRSGLDPRRLQLEVTESLFIDRADEVLETMQALRRLGVRMSMDDFGTGYSSLGYLTRFPFDKIKIDQSFVRNIERPESLAVIRSVLGLSRSMGMSVIAEGIETFEQFRRLREEGCREMQGYLFSPPCPVSHLPKAIMEIASVWTSLDAEWRKAGAA